MTGTRYIKAAIILGVLSAAAVFAVVLRLLELPDATAHPAALQTIQPLGTASGAPPLDGSRPGTAVTASPRATIEAVSRQYPNVHTAPGLTSPKVGTLSPGDREQVIGRTADSAWLAIRFSASPSGTGWVSADLLRLKPEGAAIPVTSSP